MKTLCYSVLMFILMVRACDPLYKEQTPVHFENNSDSLICFTIPDECYYDGIHPDTTMMSYWGHVIIQSLVENAACTIASSFDTYEEWIPEGSEFFSLFVYKWEPEREVLEHVDVDKECFMNDDYYVRYDLTLNDIQRLCDDTGILNIAYPPTPAMRNVKMWPPYEEVIKNAETLGD